MKFAPYCRIIVYNVWSIIIIIIIIIIIKNLTGQILVNTK
jgi:hypothetical protein